MANDDELRYYRTVEDVFASLRGVPHTLSPKDVHLLRTWWREGVPLVAVTAGITEAFARRRDRGEDDPIVSLGYCRHSVRRQARHLAEMRAGTDSAGDDRDEAVSTPQQAAASVAEGLTDVALRLRPRFPAVADVVSAAAKQVLLAAELPPAAFEEHLFALESAILQGCWTALPEHDRGRVEERSRALAAASGATGDALERTFRAHRDRELRELLGIPRLETL